MERKSLQFLKILIVFLVVVSCEEINPVIQPDKIIDNPNKVSGAFYENFEGIKKSYYSEGTPEFATGDWKLIDAMVGNTIDDRKYNSSSIRIINSGTLTMQFNSTSGASTIRIEHAAFGQDEPSNWQLWTSYDNGVSYQQVGAEVTSSQSKTLATATFTINTAGNVRVQIRKVSGGENRINIDDIQIVPFNAPVDPGTPTEPTEPTDPIDPPAGTDNSQMLMGNPSGATTVITNENNYLMDKTYYMLSYNRSRATPNWVSWHVDPSSTIGGGERQDDFRADTTLPAGWYQVPSTAFSGSGFDRGHNCPSGDRTSSDAVNSTTFLMTNMIPQAPVNNQQTWANLESYSRTLVNAGNEVYIIMGSYGIGGTGSNGYAEKVNDGKVTVPNRIWKVIVVIPQGNNDLSRVTATTRIIAVDTPNINSTSSWGQYRVSVDAIETATGYNILSALPDNIENAIESSVDAGPVN